MNNVQLAKQSDITNMLGSSNPKGINIGDTPLVGDVSQTDIADVKTQTDIAQYINHLFVYKIQV